MLHKTIIKRIFQLRKRGYSIPEISLILKISRGTASRYARKVQIREKFMERWLKRRNASKIISQRHWNIAREKTKSFIGSFSKRELALVGAALYWGEGAKKDLSLTNSDPRMIRVFIRILQKVFGITRGEMKVTLRLYEDLDKTSCLRFWSDTTGIKLEENTVVHVLKGHKSGKLKYGMCRLRVKKGGLLLKQIFAIIDGIVTPS